MSSRLRQTPPPTVRERPACMCVHDERCTSFAEGHALHLIQARLAQATPSEWTDATVEAVLPTGDVSLRTLDGDEVALWSASVGAALRSTDASRDFGVGTPVAFHARYRVLAVGTARFNVARLDAPSA